MQPAKPLIAQVVLDVPLDQRFDFLAPALTTQDVGRLVVVPFGKRQMVGVIAAVSPETEVDAAALKSAGAILRSVPAFTRYDFALATFLANYYQHPLGQVLLTGIPPALRTPKAEAAVAALVQRHLVLTDAGYATDPAALPARAVAQRRILERLRCGGAQRAEIVSSIPGAASALKTLQLRGLIRLDVVRPSEKRKDAEVATAPHQPNVEQVAASTAIADCLGRFQPFLLHGITGSGKSEVYLQAIAAALQEGRQVLVLVPEIHLTPQLEARFRERFPTTSLVSLHSHANAKARLQGWLAAQSGLARIVLGTRLAVLTPMPELGLIIVDEEHDASFKQQEGLRYSARDTAVYRAALMKCPVVLGSATPSLESWRNAQAGQGESRYQLLTLNSRAVPGARLPRVHLLDSNLNPARDGLTEPLIAALKQRLQRREQSLLFLNRRGFSPALVCSQCAWMPECPHCAARMVFHRQDRRLHCHHCGQVSAVPAHCGECGSVALAPLGQGTQRVEEALAALLPEARITRIDRDATRTQGSAARIFAEAAAGKVDILVGTQMLSKGHDFPRLTLVGVLNADDAMFSADFRAPERLFAQMVQVAGRAGRADLPGEVLIQTRFPSHPLYEAAISQDYARFAALQLEERKLAHLPPFATLVLLRVESRKLGEALTFAKKAAELARDALDAGAGKTAPIVIHPALPAALARKAGWERAQVLVQSRSRPALRGWLPSWRSDIAAAAPRSVRWVLDVDPLEV